MKKDYLWNKKNAEIGKQLAEDSTLNIDYIVSLDILFDDVTLSDTDQDVNRLEYGYDSCAGVGNSFPLRFDRKKMFIIVLRIEDNQHHELRIKILESVCSNHFYVSKFYHDKCYWNMHKWAKVYHMHSLSSIQKYGDKNFVHRKLFPLNLPTFEVE